MECNVRKENAALYGTIFEGAAEQAVDVDFTLPDYCPDIGRILRCRANPIINVCECETDNVRIEGVTRLDVVYQEGREKNVRCCQYEQPFSARIPSGMLREGAMAAASVRVDYMNCRAASQRKVGIHGAFTASVRVCAQEQTEMLTEAAGECIHTRKAEAALSQFVGRTKSDFTVSEALELSQGKPPISSVVRSCADITVVECKPIANKLILKGEAVLEIVYCTDKGGRLESMEYVIPFNQFLDMPGVDDGCVIDADVVVGAADIGLRTDSDGEYRRLTADIHAVADVKAYRNAVIPIVSDAYSTECELDIERKYLNTERFVGQTRGRCICGAVMETQKEISEVLDAWCELSSTEGSCRSTRAQVGGTVVVCAIVRLTDGDCEYMEKTCSFESDATVPAECNEAKGKVHAHIKGCTCTLTGSSKVDMRAELEYDISLYEETQTNCICSIKPDESRRKNTTERPAVVMYYAEEGEDLWSIAREYNASAEDIMNDNELTSERVENGSLLLIAVR